MLAPCVSPSAKESKRAPEPASASASDAACGEGKKKKKNKKKKKKNKPCAPVADPQGNAGDDSDGEESVGDARTGATPRSRPDGPALESELLRVVRGNESTPLAWAACALPRSLPRALFCIPRVTPISIRLDVRASQQQPREDNAGARARRAERKRPAEAVPLQRVRAPAERGAQHTRTQTLALIRRLLDPEPQGQAVCAPPGEARPRQ